jgi:hypothetical protein
VTKGLHFFRDACDDVVGKCLGCGTAHQQLPRSPTSEILQPRWKLLSQAPPGDPEEEYYRDLGYGGDIIEVNTRYWYLMSNSNSPLSEAETHAQGEQTEHHGDDVCGGGSCVLP